MPRYRKKPVEIEARQVHPETYIDIADWCGGEAQQPSPSGIIYAPGVIKITTLEGEMWAQDQDWVIRDVKGEFYPCKPDIFDATYESVE